ncbi:MAG: hypothetical protein AAFY84_18275, partial [Pseudomonadota bacterium]
MMIRKPCASLTVVAFLATICGLSPATASSALTGDWWYGHFDCGGKRVDATWYAWKGTGGRLEAVVGTVKRFSRSGNLSDDHFIGEEE